MPAFDIQAQLYTDVEISALGRLAEVLVSTVGDATHPSAAGMPGTRAQQVLMWFTDAWAAGAAAALVVEERVAAGTVYRPLAIVFFGADSPAASGQWAIDTANPQAGTWGQDVLATWGTVPTAGPPQNGGVYGHCIIVPSPNCLALAVNVIYFDSDGGALPDFNCVIMPFEDANAPVNNKA